MQKIKDHKESDKHDTEKTNKVPITYPKALESYELSDKN